MKLDVWVAGVEPMPSQARSVEETLIQMESDITNIRSCLENKPKKLSLKHIDKKLDIIIKILGMAVYVETPGSAAIVESARAQGEQD